MTGKNPFAAVFDHYKFDVAILEPSRSSADDLKIRLVNNPRTDVGYECISYDRSKDYGTAKVILDDEETEIPIPLEQALRSLRKPDEPRYLWADLLLGPSTEQQTKQARLRNEVLQNAKSTIVWLGPPGDTTADTFKVLRVLAQWWVQGAVRCNFPSIFVRATNQQMVEMMTYIASQDVNLVLPDNMPVWEDLQSVFSSSYFEAVQTIPDLIMSDNARITRGSSSIAWSDFLASFKCVLMVMGQLLKRPPSPALVDNFSKIGGIAIADTRWREGQHLELLPMIQTASDAKAADCRDYVFAMLPISKPSKRLDGTGRSVSPPSIDYSLTTEQVFQQAATFIIDERQDLLLWWAERPPVGRKIFNMPSWVPDWTSKLPSGIMGPVKMSCESNPSLRHWSESVQPQKRITIDDGKLCLQAHRLDRISSVSRIFTQQNCRTLLAELWKALPSEPSEPTHTKAERFWRTVVLNVGGATDRPSTQAAPPRSLTASFLSIVAEERVLELLGCSMEQLADEAVRERARNHPECRAIGHQCGRSEAFEGLLRRNAIGRRFFTTEAGRTGMTAFEEVNDDLKAARDTLQSTANDRGLGAMMMQGFREYLAERDPTAAEDYAKMMGEKDDERGAKAGDVIVAAVGGFHPYVLRPRESEQDGSGSTDSIRGREFTYIGDCYLHGVMEGECFSVRNWIGRRSWRTDVTVEDIKIV